MRKSKAFFILCLSFILGVAVHSLFSSDKRIVSPFALYLIFLVFGVAGIFLRVSLRKKSLSIWIFGSALFLLGVFRYAQVIPDSTDKFHILNSVGREITTRGVIDALPRLRDKTTVYTVRLIDRRGKLLLTTSPFPPHRYGDALQITCTPRPLTEYERYAVRQGISASCAFPSHLTRLASSSGSRLQAELFNVRAAFHERLRVLLPDPYGGLLAGILYGDTSGISPALKDAFRITGLAHITALSGYNITIISVVLISGLVYVGLTRKQALPVTVFLILAFVVATGAEASVVRAAIMGLLAMSAKGLGRLSRPRNALTLAGAIMLAVNPRLFRFDLGFLLSFIATVALIYFADEVERRTFIRKLPEIWEIRKAGAASLSALLFTTPILLYYSGILGPFALLTNLLVVPLVPAAMALGFIAVILDFIWHPLGLAISFLARIPLAFIIAVAEHLADFGAFQLHLSFFQALLLFLAVFLIMWRWRKQKFQPLKTFSK